MLLNADVKGAHQLPHASLTCQTRKVRLVLFSLCEKRDGRPIAEWVWQEMFSNNTALVAKKC